MKTTISNLFYLKRAKANSKGLVPVFQRITVDWKRYDTSTGKFIDPSKGSLEGAKMKGASEEARTINSHLDASRTKVINAKKVLLASDNEITIESIRNHLNGTGERQRTLIPIFEEHNRKMEILVPVDYAPGTLERTVAVFVIAKALY